MKVVDAVLGIRLYTISCGSPPALLPLAEMAEEAAASASLHENNTESQLVTFQDKKL